MATPPFGSHKVIDQRISEARLRVFDAGFDQGKYRFTSLAEVIMSALPEFALGYKPKGVPNEKIYGQLKDAADIFYSTDQYKKRGEFGELILHLLLRDFCNTVPLISKIYFKDTANVAVHGFDAIHVVEDDEGKSLWLGEAKMHEDVNGAMSSLVKDLEEHFKEDYLRKEFFCISQKVAVLEDETLKEKDHWLDLMHKHTTLDAIFKSITIPMLCVYDSSLYASHNEATEAYIKAFEEEVRKLEASFRKKADAVRTDLNIILLLLPVPKKSELLDELNKRLKSAQGL